MRLEIDGEPGVDTVTSDDVRDALLRLRPTGPRFAVLDIRFNHYIQTRVLDSGQYTLEYREGGPDRHYKADPQPRDAVIDAFGDYLAGDNRWRTAFEWRRLELA